MGLPVRQRRVLETIENALRGSDPRLAALFTLFSRLNRDEEMPRIEQMRARVAMILLPTRFRLAAARRRQRVIPGRRRAAIYFPIAFLLVTSTFVLAALVPGARSRSRCAPVAAATSYGRHNRHPRSCTVPAMVFAR